MENILITGANGQIGQILTHTLLSLNSSNYLINKVYAGDINTQNNSNNCIWLDVLDKDKLFNLIESKNISQIYHMAAILSAKGEQDPLLTWQVNMQGLLNIL